jgi:hypothetical protein
VLKLNSIDSLHRKWSCLLPLLPCWLQYGFIWNLFMFCLLCLHVSQLLFYLTVVPYDALALLIHPSMSHNIAIRFSWVFSVYLEAVLVLPNLHMCSRAWWSWDAADYWMFWLRWWCCCVGHGLLRSCRPGRPSLTISPQLRWWWCFALATTS